MKMTYRVMAGVLLMMSQVEAAFPTVSDVTIVRSNQHAVEMAYTLSDGPAIVMLNVTTNGVSVGSENMAHVSGAINTIVSGNTRHTFKWTIRNTPMSAGGIPFDADIKLVCRPLENPPDYLVVNLAEKSETPRFTFVESVDELAGGLTNNPAYWTDKMVMRRIRARNIPWVMGGQSFSDGWWNRDYEKPHEVTLTNDYWAAVFQFTRGQWEATTTRTCPAQYKTSLRRPVDSTKMELATTADETKIPALRGDMTEEFRFPHPPHPASILGMLRARTGLAFDLPGEAMWEFAARSGTTDEQWGDGSVANGVNLPGRYKDNGGFKENETAAPAGGNVALEYATAAVGSYAANRFGLYDMHGNGMELCLDWYEADIRDLNGAINANGSKTLRGADGVKTTKRGGWIGDDALGCLPWRRATLDIGGGGRAETCRFFIHSLDPRLMK